MEAATTQWTTSNGWSRELPAWDSGRTLIVAFGDRAWLRDPAALQILNARFPKSILVGCSTAGQISGTALQDGSLTVGIARFDRSRISSASADVRSATDSQTAGETLGDALAGDQLRSVLVFSDGLRVNGSDLVAGLVSQVGPDVVVTGGLAGDGDRFEQTWVIDSGTVCEGRVIAVGLYGEGLRVGFGSAGGWGIFGPERIITRSKGNVLYEVDGRPALELYKKYLGDLAADLPASALLFPLAVRPDANGRQLVRTVLSIDERDQSMTFAGDLPQGWRAQLMRSSMDRLIDGAADAASHARSGGPHDRPTLGIAVSCVGRRLVLGARTDEEIEAAAEVLPIGTHLVGFYSYGEIGPGLGSACDLNNQTMALTTLSEA